MLFGVFSGSRQPLLAVRRHQTDGQAGLVHHIGHAALSGAALQPAQLGILAAELGQSALQIGVKGVDTGGVLRLVPVDLSEKYYYPRNCNESMRIKGCFIDFLG